MNDDVTVASLSSLNSKQQAQVVNLLGDTFGKRSDQADLLNTWQRDASRISLVLLDDKHVIGIGIAQQISFAAKDNSYLHFELDHDTRQKLYGTKAIGALQVLALAKPRRGKGLGRQLSQHLVTALMQEGVRHLIGVCWNNATSETSKSLFEQAHFVVVSSSKTFFAEQQQKMPPKKRQICTACHSSACSCEALLFMKDLQLVGAENTSEDVQEKPSWFIYLLRCRDRSLYCGITLHVERRIAEHNAGKGARYTRGRGPVEVVWLFEVHEKGEALRIEYRLKRWSRVQKEALITGDLSSI